MFHSEIVFKANYPFIEQKLVPTEGKSIFPIFIKRDSMQKSIFVAIINCYSW